MVLFLLQSEPDLFLAIWRQRIRGRAWADLWRSIKSLVEKVRTRYHIPFPLSSSAFRQALKPRISSSPISVSYASPTIPVPEIISCFLIMQLNLWSNDKFFSPVLDLHWQWLLLYKQQLVQLQCQGTQSKCIMWSIFFTLLGNNSVWMLLLYPASGQWTAHSIWCKMESWPYPTLLCWSCVVAHGKVADADVAAPTYHHQKRTSCPFPFVLGPIHLVIRWIKWSLQISLI